jgi:hypothetical protein
MMNWEVSGKQGIVVYLKTVPAYTGGTEENHEGPQDCQSLGRDLILGPCEYEGMITTTS